jgi:hypothetical protein
MRGRGRGTKCLVMGNIFGLALAAAIYPTLLAGVIIILTRPEPRGQLVAFLIGGMTMSIAAGLVILYGMDASGEFKSTSQPSHPIADIVLGVVSLVVASAILRGRPRRLVAFAAGRRHPREPRPEPRQPSRTTRVLSGGSLPLTLALGALLNLPGIWYIAALKDISTGGYSTGTKILLVVGFNLVMFLLVEVPLLGYLLNPEGARSVVGSFNRWISDHKRAIAGWVALVVAVYLIAKGIIAAV